MTEINSRIQTIIHKFASSRMQFCSTTGINIFHLKQIFKEEKEITYNHIYMICKAYPELNAEWVIMGKGKIQKGLTVDHHNLLKINVKITEHKKIPLNINRRDEYYFRQSGMLLREKIDFFQKKNKLSEERAYVFVSYFFAKKLTLNNKIDAFNMYKSTYIQYSAIVSPENLNLVVAYYFTFKYYYSNIDKN